MNKKLTISAIIVLALSTCFTSANATTIEIRDDYGWIGFTYGGEGSSWNDTFIFTITEASTLRVLPDFGSLGDIYEVFADGTSLGATSSSMSPDTFSTGLWTFQAGTHQVTGIVLSSPNSFGVASIILESGVPAVPVPAAVWLFSSGLFGLIGVARCRKA